MRKKKVLALMMAAAMAAAVGAPAYKAEAAGLTQAATTEQVTYGTLSATDIALLQNFFDFEYYKAQNPDLVEVLGDDYAKLFEHFCKCGIFEGRTCSAGFDPAAYASAYSDLKDAFGTDIVKYYEHYLTLGAAENRDLTTLSACADAGITVEALAGDNVKISPAIYKLAQRIGTTDFKTVETAVERAASANSGTSSSGSSSSGATTIHTSTGTYVVVKDGGDADAYAKASGLTKVGELKATYHNDDYSYSYGYVSIYIVKGTTGYAAYDKHLDNEELASTNPLSKTTDYVVADYFDQIGTIDVNMVSYSKSSSTESSSSSDYDFTGTAYYKSEVNGETTVEDVNNTNSFRSYFYGFSGIYNEYTEGSATKTTDWQYVADSSKTATDYSKGESKSTLEGYYTNSEGTEIHYFANDTERDEYIAEFKEKNNWTPSITSEYDDYEAIDVDGNSSTVYDIGMDMNINEDGQLEVTVGVSNAENEFGYVSEMTITKEEEVTLE